MDDRQGRAAAEDSVCREVAEMAEAARRRGEPVRPGAETPSGWRVVAHAALSNTAGGRDDLWAVRAPAAEGGRVLLLATTACFPRFRFHGRPCSVEYAEHLRQGFRSRLAGVEGVLAAAWAAARPGDRDREVHGSGGARVTARVTVLRPRAPGRDPER